jgi:hypothetical protein
LHGWPKRCAEPGAKLGNENVTDVDQLLIVLLKNEVAFIVVGGVAAIAHGSARLTFDLDVVYERSTENLQRLAAALAPYNPYPRGDPPGLPFQWDIAALERGLNFTLSTSLGDIDIFGEIPGGGAYADLLPGSTQLRLFDHPCRCLSVKQLIRAKRAAGRPRDFEAIAELEAIEEENS